MGTREQVSAEDLSRLLWEVATAVQVANTGIARRLGLGGTDLAALEHLLRDGPLGPSDIAARLGIRRASATVLADRLEAAGHATRLPDPEDRRRVAVAPTAHARSEAERVLGPIIDDVVAVGRTLPARERVATAHYLSEIAIVLRASADRQE